MKRERKLNERYLLWLAFRMAQSFSPDNSSQVGAILVNPQRTKILWVETNHFPFGVKPRFERPEKYSYIEHAERNLVYAAARQGIMTAGATVYMTWYPCADCARAIIQAGIRQLVTSGVIRDLEGENRWSESHLAAKTLLKEAKVRVRYIEGPVGAEILFGGKKIST